MLRPSNMIRSISARSLLVVISSISTLTPEALICESFSPYHSILYSRSPTSWVFSTLLPNSQNTSSNGHTLYNTTSGTLSPNQTWSILYGDGTGAEGIVYADKIIVGGATVTSQAVEAATSIASQFISQAGDGFLGLGFEDGNTCSPDQCETFFGNLMKSSPEPLFTADLQPDGGSYDFGYIDKSKYVGEIAYVDVLHESPAYWDFTAGIYSVGGKSGSIGDSIMDTGTSIWYLPEDATNDFYGSFNSSYDENEGAYVYSCDETPPDFSVEIGNTTFVVPGSAINFGPVGDGTENCIGGIQYSDLLPGSIFGDMFMKNFFVVFNQGTEQIGVAKQE